MVVDSSFIEKILNSKKIRYDKLNELLDGYISDDDKRKEVNIFVDIQSVIRQLYNDDLLRQFQSVDDRNRIVIVSEIINMVGHFRNYFATRREMFTNFYFYHSFKKSNYHLDIDDNYKYEYYSKRIDPDHPTMGFLNRVLLYSMKLIKTTMTYIPNCEFINTMSIDPGVVPTAIIDSDRVKDSDINIIMSNDSAYYQDLFLTDRTYILTLQGSDKSRLITRDNLIDTILTSCKSKKTSMDYINVSPESVKIIQPMVANKFYDMKAINRMGYSRGFGIIEKGLSVEALDGFKIMNGNPDYESIAEYFFKKESDRNKYLDNVKLLDHRSYYNELYSDIRKTIDIQNIYIKDPQSLKVANQEIFIRFPLNLEFIFMGEDIHF